MGRFVDNYDVYAKAALNHSQIETKLSIGCDGIEIQLLNEMYNGSDIHDWQDIEEIVNLEEFRKYPVKAVHAPLIPKRGDVLLERVVDQEDFTVFNNVFKVADFFGKVQNEKTLIVFHSEMTLDLMKDLGTLWKNILYCLDRAFNSYPNVEFCLENVSPLRGILRDDCVALANNFYFDNVKIIKALREELKCNNLGTILDICHQMLAEKYIKGLYKLTGEFTPPDLSLKRYFEEYEDTLKLIHLCNMYGSGYGKGKHGTKFAIEDSSTVVDILALKKTYAPTCSVTLEIEESDFAVCDGYRTSLSTLVNCETLVK